MHRLRFFALVAVLALAVAACGDDTTTPSSQGSPTGGGTTSGATPLTNKGTADAASVTDFTIELDDNYFKPTFIKVKDGQKLSLELESEGSTTHTFTITGLNIDQEIAPGTKKEIEITFSGTSDVAFFCRFHGSEGMRGAFFFGSAPQGSTAGGGTSESSDNY